AEAAAPAPDDGTDTRESPMTYITAMAFDDLWDYDDPAGTEAKFRELRPELEAAGDRSALVQLDTQIARTFSLRRKFAEAHALLNEIEPELDSLDPVVRVRWLLERGRTFHSAGKKEPAKKAFLEAWVLGQSIQAEAFAVDAAHMVAIVEKDDEAIRWNELALDYARLSEDPRAKRWKGSLLNNLGWTYHGKGEHERALELFEEALAFRLEEGEDGKIDIAQWCVARELRALGRTTEALARQQELLRAKEAAGRGSDGYVFEELGECLAELGRTEEARPWFAKAYAELSKDAWLQANEAERLESLRKRGR
ncbi:tetratricopeptide repeat protein, partial [bacterium]|nr:tetratricopeptide repeat protein [bacterium]